MALSASVGDLRAGGGAPLGHAPTRPVSCLSGASTYFAQRPEKGWSLATSAATVAPLRRLGGQKGAWLRQRLLYLAGESAVQVGRMVFPAKRLCVVPSMEGVRWAFSCGNWLPSRAEWLLAVRCIQPEEKERIGQFVFARDAKAALVLEACGFWEAGRAEEPHVCSRRCRFRAAGGLGSPKPV